MPGRKNLQKHWVRTTFEQNLRGSSPTPALVIDKPEEAKEKTKIDQKKAKKRTATDVHLEIKQLVLDDNYSLARSVLLQAFTDDFKGKRLNAWKDKLMGSSLKTMRPAPEKEVLPEPKPSSTMPEEKSEMVDIPDLPDFDDEVVEVEDQSLEDKSGGAVVFGIIGAGQAGGRLAQEFYKLGYRKALAVNTAEHDLNTLADLPEVQKVVMTSEAGGGAGKDMTKGEAAADQHQQEIYEKMQTLFGKVDRIMVCAGGGGGTGGGACLRLVETSKKYLQYLGVEDANSKVGVLLTLPTRGEASSPDVASNALLVAKRLCDYADKGKISPLIMFDNDKIDQMFGKKLTVRNYWSFVNQTEK